jgi:hypothetical protein
MFPIMSLAALRPGSPLSETDEAANSLMPGPRCSQLPGHADLNHCSRGVHAPIADAKCPLRAYSRLGGAAGRPGSSSPLPGGPTAVDPCLTLSDSAPGSSDTSSILEGNHHMARIIVHAVHGDGEPRRWTLRERIVAESLADDHYSTQILERLSWATGDAEALELHSPDRAADHDDGARRDALTTSPCGTNASGRLPRVRSTPAAESRRGRQAPARALAARAPRPERTSRDDPS